MEETEWLAERFEQHRPRLRAAAYRMLGSMAEADDAVQDAWLRLCRSDADQINNLGGWLTTVVAPEPAQSGRAVGVRAARHVRAAVRRDRRDRGPHAGRRATAGQPGTAPGERRRDPIARPGSGAAAAA